MPMVGFPLLLIPLAIYNIIVFLMPDVLVHRTAGEADADVGRGMDGDAERRAAHARILLLLAEVIKGARPGAKYLTDHLLSLIVFGAAAAEFVLWPKFGTSTYFLLTPLALVDFLSGLALRTRRRAVAAVATAPAKKSVAKAEAPVAEPVPEPAPAPAPPPPAAAPVARSAPAAASIAESVLRDHPEPKPEPRPEPRLDHSEPKKPDSVPN